MIANRLTQATFKFISLVTAGANRRWVITKGADEDGAVAFSFDVPIRKVDLEKRLVIGVVYPIGEVDTQGDFMTEADLDAAMEDFQAKGRAASGRAGDVMHDENPTADFFAQVWKIQPGDPLFPEDAGAWAVARKIVDDEVLARVASGELKAFSWGGTAVRIERVEVTKSAAELAEPIRRMVSELVAKGLLADMQDRARVPQLLQVACDALWEAYYRAPATTEDEKAAVSAVVAELAAELAKTAEAKESGMDKNLLQKLADGIADLFRKAAEETPAPEQTPEPEPAAKSAEELVAEAVEASKAEHLAAMETLTAAHAAEVQTLKDEIARLESIAPPSGRLDVNGVPMGEQKLGGPYCG